MSSSSSSSEKTLQNQTPVAEQDDLGKMLEKERSEGEKTLGKEADMKGGGEGEGRDSGKSLEIEGDDGKKEVEIGVDSSEGDEEEGECGFCVFMKGGGCRESFVAWEKCIEEAEKNKEDIVEKCFEVTGMLKKCMDAHRDYYAPVLEAEKAMEEEAMKELERDGASHQAEKSMEKEAVKELERDGGGHQSVKVRESEAVKELERDGFSHDDGRGS